MAAIKVLTGDIEAGRWDVTFEAMKRHTAGSSIWKGETYDFRDFSKIETVTEEKRKTLVGTAGWAAAGAIALGPIGAIGGMLLGGNKTEVCFVAELANGKRFMATTDMKTYQKLLAATFKRG